MQHPEHHNKQGSAYTTRKRPPAAAGSPRLGSLPGLHGQQQRGNCTIACVLQVTRRPVRHGPQALPAHVRVGLTTLPRGNRLTDDLGVWAQGWSDSHSSYMGRGEARITGFPTRARLLVNGRLVCWRMTHRGLFLTTSSRKCFRKSVHFLPSLQEAALRRRGRQCGLPRPREQRSPQLGKPQAPTACPSSPGRLSPVRMSPASDGQANWSVRPAFQERGGSRPLP